MLPAPRFRRKWKILDRAIRDSLPLDALRGSGVSTYSSGWTVKKGVHKERPFRSGKVTPFLAYPSVKLPYPASMQVSSRNLSCWKYKGFAPTVGLRLSNLREAPQGKYGFP